MPGLRRKKRDPDDVRILNIRPSTMVQKSRFKRKRPDWVWHVAVAVAVILLVLALLYWRNMA